MVMTEALREAITAVYRIQPEALKTLYSIVLPFIRQRLTLI